MHDFSDDLGALAKRLAEADRYLDLAGRHARLAELEAEASRADLWDDPDRARVVTTELSRVKEDVDELEGLRRQLSDAETLNELAREEADESVEPELAQAVAELDRGLDQLELRSLFSGEHDERDAVCE